MLKNDKARAVGMSQTKGDSTTPEDLFYLAKYIYNNRNFIFKISAEDLKNNTYGESQFNNIQNMNLFADDPSFLGGKALVLNDGTESLMGVFNVAIAPSSGGEKRPIFVFISGSTDVKTDVGRIITYAQGSYR